MPIEYTNTILNELLSMHKVLSIKKPRYFENSMEHRIKMRIAKAILSKVHSDINFWNEDLLNLLLNHNNQLNINYVYELLVAKCVPNGDLILNKLNNVRKTKKYYLNKNPKSSLGLTYTSVRNNSSASFFFENF